MHANLKQETLTLQNNSNRGNFALQLKKTLNNVCKKAIQKFNLKHFKAETVNQPLGDQHSV